MRLSEAAAKRVRLTPASLKTFPAMTVGEFAKNGKPDDTRLFIDTAWGLQEVAYLRWPETDPWIVCGRGLDERSYCVHYGVSLYVEKEA